MNDALTAARHELHAAKMALAAHHTPETEARAVAAGKALRALLDAPRKVTRAVAPVVAWRVCCARGVEVRDTYYAFECRCPVHGTTTRGTCD